MAPSDPEKAGDYNGISWTAHDPNKISRLNGYDANAATYVPIVVIGAGESGLAMGCKLKQKLGYDQFRIYERQAGIGGTWWINRYPGVACDVPAVFYSFSFSPNSKWTSLYPQGPEICKYLNDVASKFAIQDKIQLNTEVEGCKWIENDRVWEVYLRHMVPGKGDLANAHLQKIIEKEGEGAVYIGRETIRARIVVSAVGGLREPNSFPQSVPGLESFEGEVFHSARWRHDVDFRNKDVVVMGTGCSAAQFVPKLTQAPYNAKSVTQVMRSPPWVVPRMPAPGGEEGYAKWSPWLFSNIPGLLWGFREMIFFNNEREFQLFGGEEKNAKFRKEYEKDLLDNLHSRVPKKYWDMLTPDYSVGCKRRVFDAAWFPGLNDERVELTTQPFSRINARSVTLGAGQNYPKRSAAEGPAEREVPADIIVHANGFVTSKWLHPLNVTGRNNTDLVDEMERRGGPQAYMGSVMDGFPNFFMIFGPNTATGHNSVIYASECMVDYSLNFIEKIVKGDATICEVKREAEEAYTADLQRALKSTVFENGGCHSWYTTGDWNGTVYPYTQIWFGLLCMFPKWSDWDISYTSQGHAKQQLATVRKLVGTSALVAVVYAAYKSGKGFEYVTDMAKQGWRSAIGALQSGLTKIQI